MFFTHVEGATDGEEVLRKAKEKAYDLMVLDVHLPSHSGFEIAEAARGKNPSLHLIFISSYTEFQNLRKAIHTGCVDYIPKPFSFSDIQRALELCVSQNEPQRRIRLSPSLEYDKSAKKLYKKNEEIAMTRSEIAFVEMICDYKGQMMTYEQIFEEVFKNKESVSIEAVANLVYRLRKKIDEELVECVTALGYRVL